MHEFYKNPDGSDIFGQIVGRTDLLLELDVGWAFSGGQDPLKLMETLKDRLLFIHIRDSVPCDQPVGDGRVDMNRLYEALGRNALGRPLGQGCVPIGQVYDRAVALGLPMVVECETPRPDGFTSAAICFETLKKLEVKER
jgi:sugar phosphate isomerase/epimerase